MAANRTPDDKDEKREKPLTREELLEIRATTEEDVDARLELGKLCLAHQKIDEAIKWFLRALELQSLDAGLILSNIYRRRNFDKAKAYLKLVDEMVDDKTDSNILLSLAKGYWELSEIATGDLYREYFSKAVTWFEEVINRGEFYLSPKKELSRFELLLLRIAEKGNKKAKMIKADYFYRRGNYSAASSYYSSDAKAGDCHSAFSMGIINDSLGWSKTIEADHYYWLMAKNAYNDPTPENAAAFYTIMYANTSRLEKRIARVKEISNDHLLKKFMNNQFNEIKKIKENPFLRKQAENVSCTYEEKPLLGFTATVATLLNLPPEKINMRDYLKKVFMEAERYINQSNIPTNMMNNTIQIFYTGLKRVDIERASTFDIHARIIEVERTMAINEHEAKVEIILSFRQALKFLGEQHIFPDYPKAHFWSDVSPAKKLERLEHIVSDSKNLPRKIYENLCQTLKSYVTPFLTPEGNIDDKKLNATLTSTTPPASAATAATPTATAVATAATVPSVPNWQYAFAELYKALIGPPRLVTYTLNAIGGNILSPTSRHTR